MHVNPRSCLPDVPWFEGDVDVVVVVVVVVVEGYGTLGSVCEIIEQVDAT